jgi:hypothetical protein
MSRLITTLKGEGFPCSIYEAVDGRVYFTADADIDVDGSGSSHGDPCYQPDTTLHHNGRALNSDVDKFIVVPPIICQAVKPKVLGCLAKVTNTKNGRKCLAVVGDIGPTKKTGEISRAVAFALGIDPSPTTGGEDSAVIQYEIFPGTAALVDDRQYELKAYGA